MNDEELGRPAVILLRLRAAERARPGACSMARLRKLCDCRMSDLLRDLTLLAGSGFVTLEHDAEGAASVRLTATGRELCGALAADGS
jgi:predicted transcriptional regulator